MTKFKSPRTLEVINKELDETWQAVKELGKGKYKNESRAFKRDLRNQFKQKFNDLYNEMADREFKDREDIWTKSK